MNAKNLLELSFYLQFDSKSSPLAMLQQVLNNNLFLTAISHLQSNEEII